MAQATAKPAADTVDPVSNAVVTPQASLFLRQMIQAALANQAAAPQAWTAQAQALLANLLMNDYLNSWNSDFPPSLADAQNAVDEAMKSTPSDYVSAAAHHAQGLIHRAQGNQPAAADEFEKAISLEPGYARAHAQIGNQKVLLGKASESHKHFSNARRLNPFHPAIGYFDWGEGRAYFEQQDWPNAVHLLKKSVAELPTVWYNRCYLAYAQNAAGQPEHATATMREFLSELGNDALKQAVAALQKNPARKTIGDWLQQFVQP